MSDFKTPKDIIAAIGKEQAETPTAPANNSDHIRLHSNIPLRYKDAKFEAITEQQEKLVEAFRDNFNGNNITKVSDMLIMGSVGVGKTHISIALLNKLIDGGIYCRYTTEYNLLELHLNGYNDRDSKKEFNKFKEVKLLLLDELGKRELTDNQITALEELLSYRYNEMLPTIILTNMNTSQFKSFIGDRATDRLKDNSVIRVILEGESLRGEKNE